MPEEMEKAIREMPRDAAAIDLPKKLSGEIVDSSKSDPAGLMTLQV